MLKSLIKATDKIELTIINKDKSKQKFVFDSIKMLDHALIDFINGKEINSSNTLK